MGKKLLYFKTDVYFLIFLAVTVKSSSYLWPKGMRRGRNGFSRETKTDAVVSKCLFNRLPPFVYLRLLRFVKEKTEL